AELVEMPGQLEQDLLGHVLHVRVLQLPAATPGRQHGRVALDEGLPGLGICGVAQEDQKRGTGPRFGMALHKYYSCGWENLTRILGAGVQQSKQKPRLVRRSP